MDNPLILRERTPALLAHVAKHASPPSKRC